MPQGFFTASDLLVKRPLPSLLPRCGACGLLKTCQSPKMPVAGRGERKILVVGEAPGATEDEHNQPFIGQSGQLLQRTLEQADVNLFRDCWVTNSLACRPVDNATPTEKQIDYCRPNLLRALQELKPEVILLLGASAVKSLLSWLWKEDVGKIGRWVGWQIPSQKLNTWVCPTWHPAAILRNERDQQSGVMELLFKRHLKAACSLKGRPWAEVPDYRKDIRLIFDPLEADVYLDGFLGGAESSGKPVAFDYECEGLKPDNGKLQIVSCSLSDGESTCAFPWHGPVIKRMQTFLRSLVPKIASNAKYEERWTRKVFGHGVRNWAWDTMLAAHALDNRPGITGLKFQAFVQLGVDAWDEQAKPFLRADGSNAKNRIREVSLDKLLLYNAYDSLHEWQVAQVQARQLGIKLC